MVLVLTIKGGSSGPPATTTTTTSSPAAATRRPTSVVGIGLRTYEFTDATRSTFNYLTGATTKGRSVGVELRYPTRVRSAGSTDHDNAPIARRRAYPLVVFAPGYRLDPRNYLPLLDAWVRAGFMVAAITFPNTSVAATAPVYAAGLPHGSPESDEYVEPADVDVVLDRLLTLDGDRDAWLHGLIAPEDVALAGHSDGGDVVAALVYDAATDLTHPEIRAVAVLSGGEFPIANQRFAQPDHLGAPLLVVQSETDTCNPPDNAILLYNAIGGPKGALILDDASHLGAYDGTDAKAFALVASVTMSFFEQAFTGASSHPIPTTVSGVGSYFTAPTLAALPTPTGAIDCPVG